MIKISNLKFLLPMLCLCGAALIATENEDHSGIDWRPVEAGERIGGAVDLEALPAVFTYSDRFSTRRKASDGATGDEASFEPIAQEDGGVHHQMDLPILAALPQGAEELVMNEKVASAALNSNGFSLAASLTVNSSHLGAFHELQTFWWQEGIVALEDGSHWILSDPQAGLHFFYPGAVLAIGYTNNYDYPYWLTNQHNGISIMAKLWKIHPNSYSRRVVAIDYFNSVIWLNDGSKWEIALEDTYKTLQYSVNDWLIIGSNSDSYSPFYPNILINVNNNKFVRAICAN